MARNSKKYFFLFNLFRTGAGETGVTDYLDPEEVVRVVCDGDIEIRESGMEDEAKVAGLVAKVVQHSVKTENPYFLNSLYHGTDRYSKIGSYVTEMMNTSAYTFEVAPVFSTIERHLLRYVVNKLDWKDGDGLMNPGGSMSNAYGIIAARHRRFPDIKSKGLSGLPPLVIYTSTDSHYSMEKSANWLGIGLDNVVKVACNARGQMVAEELDRAIAKSKKEGKVPLFVNATFGSTVVGGFDDVRAIHKVTQKYPDDRIWIMLMLLGEEGICSSPELKEMYMAHTTCWTRSRGNPHKMLGAVFQASLFLVHNKTGSKDFNLLQEANCAKATYLFQSDKFYDTSYDTGDKSFQCGRKVDAFKVWLMLKVRGEKHVRETVEECYKMSRLFVKKVKDHDNFRLVLEPSCTNINFVYVPPRLKEAGLDEEAWKAEMAKIPPKLKEQMTKQGSMMIGYQPLAYRGLQNFFRIVFHCQPVPTEENLDFIISEIHRLGRDL